MLDMYKHFAYNALWCDKDQREARLRVLLSAVHRI